MPVNSKQSPISIRMKPIGGTLINFTVIDGNSGKIFTHIFDYTKLYVASDEEDKVGRKEEPVDVDLKEGAE